MAGPYNKLTILSAFVKSSGVLRLKPTLEQFKSAGGYIEAFMGVDVHGTSYEVVLNLFELCNELYYFANLLHLKITSLSPHLNKQRETSFR